MYVPLCVVVCVLMRVRKRVLTCILVGVFICALLWALIRDGIAAQAAIAPAAAAGQRAMILTDWRKALLGVQAATLAYGACFSFYTRSLLLLY